MNKGYIIPFVLILLLLVLAGFFVFTPAQSPSIQDEIKRSSKDIQNTSNQIIEEQDQSMNSDISEENNTSTTTIPEEEDEGATSTESI